MIAQVFDLQPGQMISIPQYMPHRIENRDGLNVTLVTRHMTPVAERHNNVHRANRLLRPLIPAAANHDRVSGVTAVIKDAIVRLLLSKSQDISVDPATEKTFCLDPDAPNCVKPLSTPGDVATTTAGPMITSFGLETTTSTSSAVLEH